MDKKRIWFLIRSFALLIVTCITVFLIYTIWMKEKTNDSVKGVSDAYMEEINAQVHQKFQTFTYIRIDQVSGMVKRTPADPGIEWEELKKELATSTEVRGFQWLGLVREDGEVVTVYGEDLLSIDDATLKNSIKEDGNIITRGRKQDESRVFIFGTKAAYPLQDGTKSIAMIAAIDMSSVEGALFRDSKDSREDSYLISQEGDYIIRNGENLQGNYFERLRMEVIKGSGTDAEDCINGMKEAMKNGRSFIQTVSTEEGVQHMYCSPMSENAHWYLVTIMPDEVFGGMLSRLDESRSIMTVVSIVVILLVILFIFLKYYRITKEEIRIINNARHEAEQANMAKSSFLASMSHDIRTPMNAIVGMTEIAIKNKGDKARLQDCLDKIKLSSKQLLGLINDVLDMSKIESGKMTLAETPLSLRDALDDVVNIIKPQLKDNNQYFDVFIHDIIAEEVCCDGVRLNQVLLNILSNALKFTKENGRINVTAYQEPSQMGDGYVRTHFIVEDTGIGMSKEFQKTIFDKFAREETGEAKNIAGTGLGMAITKKIIDMMEGTIEIDSELNRGSKFHIILDMKKVQINVKDMKLPAWNILVVDDDQRLCASAVSNLEELGVHAESCQDGEEAVRMMKERHDRGEDYQFVLMDWKMPKANGLDVIREIRGHINTDRIPFFLISAYDWGDIEDAISDDVEIAGFIAKPLFKSTLYMHLSKYMDDVGETEPASEERGVVDFGNKRILLSEDIDLNWEVANAILSEMGLVIDRAVNGKECLDMFEAAEPGYYDAILMDIRMPVMNGYDSTKAIRALDRPDSNLPIIALTADAFSDDAEHCRECGMNDHITKPIDVKDCTRTLSKYFI